MSTGDGWVPRSCQEVDTRAGGDRIGRVRRTSPGWVPGRRQTRRCRTCRRGTFRTCGRGVTLSPPLLARSGERDDRYRLAVELELVRAKHEAAGRGQQDAV